MKFIFRPGALAGASSSSSSSSSSTSGSSRSSSDTVTISPYQPLEYGENGLVVRQVELRVIRRFRIVPISALHSRICLHPFVDNAILRSRFN